jgi:hypothetical protein
MKTVRKGFLFLNTVLETDFKIQAHSFLTNLIAKMQTSSELRALTLDALKT